MIYSVITVPAPFRRAATGAVQLQDRYVSMKKHLFITLLLLVLVGVFTAAFWFYRQNLRGISPAVFGSSRDIAALVRGEKSPLSHPADLSLSIFAEGLTGPRDIAIDPGGTLLVSMSAAGRVVALPDADGNGRADQIVDVVSGLRRPHGLAFSSGADRRLFVAEEDRVMAYEYDEERFQAGSAEKITDLPAGGGHSTRSLLFLPPPDKDTLLISVGSSCNVCEEKDWRRAKILAIDTTGGELRTFAAGLRNAVFLTVHPRTGAVWATEMGRDYLGDDLPPDEINRIRFGNDYGWPSCYGDNVPDVEYHNSEDASEECRGKTPSFIDIQAHSAPLGLDFFPAAGWPEEYRHQLLVAYHGSWNRTVPTGYKIVLFRFDGKGNLLDREDFVSGWLQDGETSLGRPVDIEIMADGRIFVSDDKAGVIYQLTLKHDG